MSAPNKESFIKLRSVNDIEESCDAHPVFAHACTMAREFFLDARSLKIALGYAFFRAANSLLFSTLLAEKFGASLLAPGFLVTFLIDLFFVLLGLGLAYASHRGKIRLGRLPVVIPTVVLIAVVGLALFGAFPNTNEIVGVVLLAFAYAGVILVLNLAWTELLVSGGLVPCLGAFASGMFIRAIIEALLLPFAFPIKFAAMVIMFFASVVLLKQGRHTLGTYQPLELPRAKDYLVAFKYMGSSICIMVFLDASMGFLNGYFLGQSLFREAEGILLLGSIAASLCFLLLTFLLPVWQDQKRAYRILFPLLAATIALLPFAGDEQYRLLGVPLLFSYNLLSSCALYFILAETVAAKLNACIVMGSLTALGRGVQALFLFLGFALGDIASRQQLELFSVVSIAAVYGLAMLLLVFSRKRKRIQAQNAVAPNGEGEPSDNQRTRTSGDTLETLCDDDQDYFSQRTKELALEYRLTPRETEVLAHIGRGRSTTFISQEFVCSPGTVRTHTKSIFVKLGVHSRQEVIDLFVR